MSVVKFTFGGVVIASISAALFIYSGIYSVAADEPHWRATTILLNVARERSIERHSKQVEVPDLSDPELLKAGASDYQAMCAGCHLKPDVRESDLWLGLYPQPPNLALSHDDHEHAHEAKPNSQIESARRQFWVIKHGIKASGMPAWGLTHSDQRIWAMVAFLQKLPELESIEYEILTL